MLFSSIVFRNFVGLVTQAETHTARPSRDRNRKRSDTMLPAFASSLHTTRTRRRPQIQHRLRGLPPTCSQDGELYPPSCRHHLQFYPSAGRPIVNMPSCYGVVLTVVRDTRNQSCRSPDDYPANLWDRKQVVCGQTPLKSPLRTTKDRFPDILWEREDGEDTKGLAEV